MLTIVNEGSLLTNVNDGLLVTLVNKTTNFIKSVVLNKRSFLKKNTCNFIECRLT